MATVFPTRWTTVRTSLVWWSSKDAKSAQLVMLGDNQLEILEKVYFKTGSAKLQRRSFALLDNVAAVLNAHPEIKKARIEGHTDSTGSLRTNMRLSKARANTVVRYLVRRGGVDKSRLVAEGFGPTRPLIPDAITKEERAHRTGAWSSTS